MTPESVDKMLSEYKTCMGRCNHLTLQIEAYSKEIERFKKLSAENLAYSSGNTEEGMPHGTSVGNPTERMGIMLASGYEPPEMVELIRVRDELQKELDIKIVLLQFVVAWLGGLTEKEKWMIEGKVFEGKTYNEMILGYKTKFNENCSRDKLRELRKSAMKKIYEMAS